MRSIILFIILLAPSLTQAEFTSSHRGARTGWSRTSFVADGPFTIKVIVDGRVLNHRPQAQVNGVAISPGSHAIRVIAYGPRRTKELRDRIYVPRGGHHKLFVRSAGRSGPIFLERVGHPGNRSVRRGRLHDTGRYQVRDQCYEARHFNVDQVVEQMRCQPFDHAKLEIAKSAVYHNSLFADDLRYLMEQFAFDQSKVELATFAYSQVCNGQDFYVIFGTLSFQSSVRKIKRQTGYF